ncbi:hypothetical protein ACA910_015251 [Epithemia clementina (nom. ined.)]
MDESQPTPTTSGMTLRGTAPTQEDAWQVGAAITKTASYYGIQDAARKRRAQTQRPGAWAGVVCETTPMWPYITITQSKWEQTKSEIAKLRAMVVCATEPGGDGKVDHKTLEQVAGFLNHVTRAFPTIKIYLNGVYAAMNSWRPDRDEEGWRVGDYKVECETQSSTVPKRVRMVKHMTFDVKALEDLTQSEIPPERMLRPCKHGARARYVFADASGAGLGTSEWGPGNMEVQVDYGAWGLELAEGTSSNFRELANIVFKIERMDQQGALTELTEVFVFTDNYPAESAFYRGTAKSPKVLELMHGLHKILMKGRAFIHIVWVSGKRMIDQGTDGLSRWDLTNRVMCGEDMLSFVQIHLTAIKQQSSSVTELVNSCFTSEEPLRRLAPQDWFHAPYNEAPSPSGLVPCPIQ